MKLHSVRYCKHCTKMNFFVKDFFSKLWPNPQETAELVAFTTEILTGKFQFFYSENRNTGPTLG